MISYASNLSNHEPDKWISVIWFLLLWLHFKWKIYFGWSKFNSVLDYCKLCQLMRCFWNYFVSCVDGSLWQLTDLMNTFKIDRKRVYVAEGMFLKMHYKCALFYLKVVWVVCSILFWISYIIHKIVDTPFILVLASLMTIVYGLWVNPKSIAVYHNQLL